MPKVLVVLSGCGVYDGAEIHEAVVTLLALDRAGAEVTVAAPDKEQLHVINHATGDAVEGETRNVLVESSRITRGQIKPLSEVNAAEFDATILPGGFGAAKNLCTYAVDGPDMKIDPHAERVILETVRAAHPLGAMCIAPVLVAKVLAETGFNITVTIGNDEQTAQHIESFQATHQVCAVDDIVVDEFTRVVTTPAYMLAQNISDAAAGIEKLVASVLKFTEIGQ